ncbi:MAG: hypothetical protein ABI760_13550 [Ferruginibacter sp.]
METNHQTTTEKEDSIADYHNDIRQIELKGYEAGVRRARNALYWTAGLVFLGEMIAMFTSGAGFNIYVLLIALFEAGIFVVLALWTKKKPYTAIITGLAAFIGIILFSAIVNTYSEGGVGFLKAIFSGIIVKVIILLNLIKALNDGKALQDAREEIA